MLGFSYGGTVKSYEILTGKQVMGGCAARIVITTIVKHFRFKETILVEGLLRDILDDTGVDRKSILELMDEVIYSEIDMYVNAEKGADSEVILITELYRNRNPGSIILDRKRLKNEGLIDENGVFKREARTIKSLDIHEISRVHKPSNRYCNIAGSPICGSGAYKTNLNGRVSLEMKNAIKQQN